MVDNNQQQEKPQDFELIELLFGKVDSSASNAVDQSFEARYQSLVDQIQSYLHSSEKPGFFPHRFLGSFSSVLDTKLNDKLGIKKLHFHFEGARTLKVVAETESKTHVFIFTEEIEAQHSNSPQTRTRNFEFTTGEFKSVMGRDYTESDARKLQIDVIKILKDKYELVKSRPKSDKDVKSKKLYLYVKKDGVLEYVAKDIHGGAKATQINRDELKGNDAFKNKFFDEIKQFLDKSGKDLSDDVRKELSRLTSVKGYTLKSDGEDEKINIKVESKKKIIDQPIEPTVKFQKVAKKLGKSVYLESYIEKLANPGAEVDQVRKNLEDILNYIKKVHTNLDLQDSVYGNRAREADQHGFVAGIFDNFRYRDNTKLYLEQFAGGGYADIVLLVRGPNRAVDSVPILIELKAGTEGQVDPSDALRQAEDYIEGFRPNKMRILTNADNAIAVGLNLDNAEPFKTEVKPIKQPPAPLMEEFVKLAHRWNNQQISEEDFKQEIAGLLSSEYHTFPANKETKDHYYFSRDILGQSILINKVGQDQDNVKKYIYSYNEYPLNWPQGTEYTLSKSPVTTLIFVQGNEGQEKTAFIFHIRESNTKEFYADKKIPVLNIPGIGEVKDVIETKMSLRKYETGLSFEELFEIEQISKYNPSGADQQFTGSFLKIPNSDELKAKLDQAITSQHASDGEVSLQAYKVLLSEVADTVYPIKDLITNEARLQAVLNGLLSSYSDLKLKETSTKQQDSAKTVIIPEFQVGAGGRVDMVIQGIGPSPQGTKEYTPIALEFKLIDKNLDEEGMKKEVDKLTKEQNVRYAKGAALKAITDSDKMFFMGVVVNVKAKDKNSLILTSDKFVPATVVHSSIFDFSQQQCSKGRKQRSIGMACIDSRDEEKITEEEKRNRVKELFGIESYGEKIITIDSPQVRIDGGKMNVKFKDNNGNDKELIIDNATNIKNIENYILDKKNLEIKLKVSSDKEYAIIEEIKEQGSEYYLKIDDYRIKLDSIFQDGKEVIFDKLHQLSNDKQLLENKKYIEDIGDVQTNQDYSNIVEEIKQHLLAKGVREDTFDRFKNHFDDLGEKVFADYISNVESSLQEKGIAFDRDKFDSAKIKGAKGGKFFSMMAIYDLLDSIGDTATLGRHNNDGLKQVFGINGILDAMDDVRTSVSISSNSKVGKLVSKIPQDVRQTFVKIISNPVVQSITFATIAYQFGYSINEIAQGNHHPLNYYWTASSGVKLASMSIRPISASVSFTVKSVSATTKILRGLSATSKVLSRAAIVTMVADVLITIGIEVHERMEYTKAIAEQVPLLPGSEQAEVFFAGVIKFFTGRDVEKEYEDTIRIKGYLNYVKEVAIRLLDDNYDIAAVVQYVTSIKEKYSEIIRYDGKGICSGSNTAWQCIQYCRLEEKYNNISFSQIGKASNVKNDLSLLEISKVLPMITYTLNMQGFECALPVLGSIAFPAGSFIANKCLQESYKKEKVYVVNTDAKHIPHLTKYEYETLGLRIVDVPLKKEMQQPDCIDKSEIHSSYVGNQFCNSGKIHRDCQRAISFSGEPFIFTNPTRKEHSNTKKQTFPRGSVLYISGPKTLTAAANYPAVMHIPEGSNIRYVGSKNNETIFIINDYTSGTLEGRAGKENTLVMNVKANNIVADLHGGTIHYGNGNNIILVNTHNYVSSSDSKQNITTHCKTRFINVKNAEVWQNSLNCTDKDYEVRVVNKENVHHRGLKQTIFVVNEDSDNAKIVSDLGSTGKIKGNIDIIKVQVANITQWGISEDIEKVGYSLYLLANDTQSIVSSTKIDDFKNLIIQVNCSGVTESVAMQDKSLFDTAEDIRYQKLKNSGNDISGEVIQNSEKKLKAFIQASIIDQELFDAYQIAKGIAGNNNFDIPVSQIEVIKNRMGIPSEKVIIAGMYSGQVIVDFSYNNSDVTSSYQKYRSNRGSYSYDDYMVLCNYYQDITVEGEKEQHQYIIKLPDTLNSKISSSPIRLNLKIKNKAVPIPYNIIDFAELSVTDVDSISIEEGKRSYINACYSKSISDLTEDSLEIKDITILDSKGTKWSLSIGLVDYFQSPENQQIVLQMNNELYKIDSTNLRLEHVGMNPNSFRYYQPEEQGLQIYHNQPTNKNDVGLVDFRDKSILDFDTEITDDSLVLSHKNNTLAKVENWNTYQPAREMMFAFNDTMVSNLKCIVSACNSKDIIENFNKEKVTVLKEKMFDAIVRDNINEANDLIRKIETIEGKSGLTPLYIAIQAGRLEIVKTLFDRKHSGVQGKDVYPLHLAAQEGKLNIAKFLVDKGADIGAKGNDGRTPLRMAAYNGDLEMVKFFLDKNASIENNDPYKMMKMVDVLKKEIINQADTSSNVRRWAEFFAEKLRYSIKSVAQEKLKDGMLRNRYSAVNELANEIYKSDGKLFDDIIKKVINEVYGKVDTKKILSFVRDHGYIAQLIPGYIAVFDTMQRNNDLNNGAVFKLAYYIKEAMEMEHYPDVDQEKKSHLEELKSRLPESVRNAVFASKVCIKNIDKNEYLYAASNYFSYDDDRRRVFTWIPKDEKNDKFRWEIKLDGDDYSIMNVELMNIYTVLLIILTMITRGGKCLLGFLGAELDEIHGR